MDVVVSVYTHTHTHTHTHTQTYKYATLDIGTDGAVSVRTHTHTLKYATLDISTDGEYGAVIWCRAQTARCDVMYVCMCACVYLHTLTHVCVRARIHTYIRTCACVCMRSIHTYVTSLTMYKKIFLFFAMRLHGEDEWVE
jgi:hypothetical protein